MRRATPLALHHAVAGTLAAGLLLAGCSTQYLDASPAVLDASTNNLDALAAGQTSTTKHAGLNLINAIFDSSQLLHIDVDGTYFGADSGPGNRFATMGSGPLQNGVIPTVPDCFPDGTHTFALVSENGQKIIETEQNFVAGAWNLMYVYGSISSPTFKFFTEPVPGASNKVWVRMVNLMTTQEPVNVVSCTEAACQTPVISGLAYGESWAAEVSTSVYGFAFTSPAGGSLVAPAALCTTQSPSPTTARECAVMSGSTIFTGPGPY